MTRVSLGRGLTHLEILSRQILTQRDPGQLGSRFNAWGTIIQTDTTWMLHALQTVKGDP